MHSFDYEGVYSAGVSLELPDMEKFETFSGSQGEVLVQLLDFPICSIHLNFSLGSI